MPETISYDASFPEIFEAFSSRGCATLVVTANDRPLGYLTCDGFLSMIDPIDAESFAKTEASADELNYLVVPTLIGEAAAQKHRWPAYRRRVRHLGGSGRAEHADTAQQKLRL